MRELEELLAGTSDAHPLDLAALQIAAVEGRAVEPDPTLRVLDQYADELRERLEGGGSGAEFVHALNELLFTELGYRGDEVDYYNPENSFLDRVVASRKGIPISLAVVYLEVARRAGRSVYGIGLPGHFVVEYADAQFRTYLDVFHGGVILTVEDCVRLVKERSGMDIAPGSHFFERMSKRAVLARMISNLRAIYISRGDYPRAFEALSLLLLAHPDSAEEWRQRGVVALQCQRLRVAMADLQSYLVLAPNAPDRPAVIKQIEAIQKRLAALN